MKTRSIAALAVLALALAVALPLGAQAGKEDVEALKKQIQALTAEDVQAVANKYLDPARMTLVVLKPGGGEASAE